ncbi:MAG: sigma-70 family RNA polymerase sigma factor [Kofleriaceae bacterium]|nr:sigma-70 family RNA polymerase sigma factor [Kofleriaceae bacterium]
MGKIATKKPARRTAPAARTEAVRAKPQRASRAAKPAKAAPATAVPAPAPAANLSDLAEPAAKAAPARTARIKTDPEDHLSTYFRDLAVHELLGPEQEREIAQGIEDQEILTWERIFARPEVVPHVVSLIDGKTETPINLKKLAHAAELLIEARTPARKRPDPRKTKKLEVAAREVAEQLRAQDLDRLLVEAVLRDFRRIQATTGRSELRADLHPPFAVGAGFDAYLDGVQDAYQGSSALREEFIRANLRLVVTMARRYDRGGMPLADLIQEGNLGLMHAVSRFDYRRGLRFSTYACWWIRHAIGRALADKARAVRIPVHMLEAQQQLEKVRQRLIAELGRQPTPQELAKAARVPLAKLNQMHRYLMGQPMSLDRPMHEDDDRAFGDMLADPTSEDASPAEDMTNQALAEQVTKLLRDLSPIEADVLRKRFGLLDDEERTFREIGDQYRLSRERIRQIQNSALDKLKKALAREHPGLVDN